MISLVLHVKNDQPVAIKFPSLELFCIPRQISRLAFKNITHLHVVSDLSHPNHGFTTQHIYIFVTTVAD